MTKLQANINYVNLIFVLIVLEILFGFSSSLSIIRPGKPLIKSVRQLNESSIELAWVVGNLQFNFNDANLKRYRIFYRNEEDFDFSLFEWPGQIMKTNEELLRGAYYYTYNTSSTFDCYNQCIKNPTCDFAQSINHKDDFYYNCLLYNRPNDDNISDKKIDTEEIFVGNDGEIMKISDYTDKIVLQNVPANKNFLFQVGVYDEDLNSWSEISEEYEMFQMKINIELSYETNFDGSILLKWKQFGPFKNYVISRYNITVKSSLETKSYQSYTKELSKYKLGLDYYELDKNDLKQKVSSENECFQMCLKKSSCIRYVYFISDYRCYLLTNLNLTKSIYRNKQSSAFSIKSESNSFKLSNLKSFTDYTVQLHFKTPFGDTGYSNAIKFSTGEILNQDNNELNEYEIQELDDGSNSIGETNDQTNQNDDSNKKNTTSSSEDIDNIHIDSGEYYYVYEEDNSFDSYFDNEDPNSAKTNKIKKRKTTTLPTTVNIISTRKNAIEEEITKKVESEPSIQKPEDIKENQQTSNLNNKEDEDLDEENVPSIPKIVNATIQKDVLWIKWNVENNGGSNIKNVILEWSPDFSNKSLPVEAKNLNWEQKKSDKTNQVFLNGTSVSPNNEIRLTVTNENGASEKSSIFLVKCLGQCDALNKEEIKGGGINSPNTKPDTYMTKKTGMIILILTAILISFILIYVIYDCRRSIQNSHQKEQTNEENEQDEKLIKKEPS